MGIEEELLCPICFERFSSPRSLNNCLHTFCEECLFQTFSSYEKKHPYCIEFPCPVCRKKVNRPANSVTRDWIKMFPINHLVNSLLHMTDQDGGSEPQCEPCSCLNKSSEADNFCTECQEFMCNPCCQLHRNFKATRSHSLVPVSELKTDKKCTLDLSKFLQCQMHKDRQVELFCVDDNMPVCVICVATSHRNCKNVVELKGHAESSTAIEKSRHQLTKLKEMHETLTTQISQMEQNRTDLAAQESEIIKNIESKRIQVMSILNMYDSKVMDQFKNLRYKKVEILNEELMKQKRLLSSVKSSCITFDTVMKYGSRAHTFATLIRNENQFEQYEYLMKNECWGMNNEKIVLHDTYAFTSFLTAKTIGYAKLQAYTPVVDLHNVAEENTRGTYGISGLKSNDGVRDVPGGARPKTVPMTKTTTPVFGSPQAARGTYGISGLKSNDGVRDVPGGARPKTVPMTKTTTPVFGSPQAVSQVHSQPGTTEGQAPSKKALPSGQRKILKVASRTAYRCVSSKTANALRKLTADVTKANKSSCIPVHTDQSTPSKSTSSQLATSVCSLKTVDIKSIDKTKTTSSSGNSDVPISSSVSQSESPAVCTTLSLASFISKQCPVFDFSYPKASNAVSSGYSTASFNTATAVTSESPSQPFYTASTFGNGSTRPKFACQFRQAKAPSCIAPATASSALNPVADFSFGTRAEISGEYFGSAVPSSCNLSGTDLPLLVSKAVFSAGLGSSKANGVNSIGLKMSTTCDAAKTTSSSLSSYSLATCSPICLNKPPLIQFGLSTLNGTGIDSSRSSISSNCTAPVTISNSTNGANGSPVPPGTVSSSVPNCPFGSGPSLKDPFNKSFNMFPKTNFEWTSTAAKPAGLPLASRTGYLDKPQFSGTLFTTGSSVTSPTHLQVSSAANTLDANQHSSTTANLTFVANVPSTTAIPYSTSEHITENASALFTFTKSFSPLTVNTSLSSLHASSMVPNTTTTKSSKEFVDMNYVQSLGQDKRMDVLASDLAHVTLSAPLASSNISGVTESTTTSVLADLKSQSIETTNKLPETEKHGAVTVEDIENQHTSTFADPTVAAGESNEHKNHQNDDSSCIKKEEIHQSLEVNDDNLTLGKNGHCFGAFFLTHKEDQTKQIPSVLFDSLCKDVNKNREGAYNVFEVSNGEHEKTLRFNDENVTTTSINKKTENANDNDVKNVNVNDENDKSISVNDELEKANSANDEHEKPKTVNDKHGNTLRVSNENEEAMSEIECHVKTLVVDDEHDKAKSTNDENEKTESFNDVPDKTQNINNEHKKTNILNDDYEKPNSVNDENDKIMSVINNEHEQSISLNDEDVENLNVNSEHENDTSGKKEKEKTISVNNESEKTLSVNVENENVFSVNDTHEKANNEKEKRESVNKDEHEATMIVKDKHVKAINSNDENKTNDEKQDNKAC